MFTKSRPMVPARSWSAEGGGELLLWSRRRTQRREDCVAMTEMGGYLEQTLPPAERERVESHVAQCDACRHELVELYQLLKAPLEPAPHGLAGDIAAAVSAALEPADLAPVAKGAKS